MTAGRVQGGFNQYGFTVGILMLDTQFPRIPGDMGNASTFPFPVRYQRVEGADPDLVVRRGAAGLLPAFIEGAHQLQHEGVGAITTNCGFLVKFQRELAAAVRVPVFTSSLLLVPLVHRLLPPGRRVGIMTVNAAGLTQEHLTGAGIGDIPIAVAGMEGALPSVVAGLIPAPVIAVPTSVGYGASFEGLAALLGMLNSCAPGVSVVNIDNGFGAGVIAARILSRS